ncbi:ubiquitin carrier protein [Meredithblackwellia eburnea MCA 4105]
MAPASMAAKRIQRELKEVQKPDNMPPGCSCGPIDEAASIFEWQAQIEGPTDSPYENGIFDLLITLPPDFPFRPPRVQFKTKVYHCNINPQGGICLDILKSQWSPALSIVKVILSISSLLSDPNPHDPLVPDIAQRFLKDRKGHDKTAREWTKKYALPAPGAKTTGESSSKSGGKAPVEVIIID